MVRDCVANGGTAACIVRDGDGFIGATMGPTGMPRDFDDRGPEGTAGIAREGGGA